MPDRCSVCTGKYLPVPAAGPYPAKFLLIGERPGQTENRRGYPFVGPAGKELNNLYLPLCGLSRPDVRVTNCVLCWAEEDRTPTPSELANCSSHFLPAEIRRTNPEYIILLGGTACKLIPGLSLEMTHGAPQLATIFDWTGIVIPMYHPALGLHEGKWMTQIIEDWERLNLLLGLLPHGVRPAPRPVTYRPIRTGQEVTEWLGDSTELACDTEDHAGVPWSIQISCRSAEARLIHAYNHDGLDALAVWLGRHPDATWIFHHAVHDLDICYQLGIEPSRWRYLDTMTDAWRLANLPQGLKPLVYRLFGHTMTTWEDVVRPASLEALVCWAVEALDIARADLSLIDVKRLKTKVREIVKKGPAEALLDRIIRCSRTESNYDPWARLDAFWRDPAYAWMSSHIEARIGRYPSLGIANAPLDRALAYACGDADWTLETAHELDRRLDLWGTDRGDDDE